MQQNLTEQYLTRDELIALKNKRLGMTIFQISWIMAFICLVIVNLQLRGSYATWPPPGVEKLGVVLPTLATVGLGLSVFLARRGLQMLRRDNIAAFLSAWMGALALGVLFILIMIYEWLAVPMGTQYGTVFRLMTGFHGIHALVIGLYMFNVYQQARAGHYHALNAWAVEAGVKLWYFVAFAWMMFYIVLYWV